MAEKGAIEKLAKKKKIKKDKPLIIQRFEPGTHHAQKIVKKAEDRKKYEEGLKKHEIKSIKKRKNKLESGVDNIKRAEEILGLRTSEV